jgi:ribosomal RNA assembly protein
MIDLITIPEERLKILRINKKWLEQFKKLSDVKIVVKDEIAIEGEDPISVMRAKEVIRAFGRGFDFDTALNLLDEEYVLVTIEVTEFSGKSRKRQVVLKGRVIGTKGKMKKMIEKYTDVKIAVYGKTISIIGRWNDVAVAREAIEMLLNGAEHSTVYRFLEKHKVS